MIVVLFASGRFKFVQLLTIIVTKTQNLLSAILKYTKNIKTKKILFVITLANNLTCSNTQPKLMQDTNRFSTYCAYLYLPVQTC